MLADMEVDMVADMFADKVTKLGVPNLVRELVTQFGERVGHRGWLSGPKLFRPEAYPTCGFLSFASLFYLV